ncbi:MAG: ABC transporter permease subunit [Chloroflexia bacterium]|nr:ABC transporter permease subunit [Chloroflexia bacterium]
MLKKLFKIGGTLPKKTTLIIEVAGFVSLVLIWWILTHPFSTLQLQYNANNGTGPYTFEWTGPDGFTKTTNKDGFLKGLKEGTYNVTLTDSSGKKVSASIELSSQIGDTAVVFPKGAQIYSGEDEELPLGIRIDAITKGSIIDKAILPSPMAVLSSYKELHFKNALVKNTWISIKLNVWGYIEAIIVSLIVGFIIGLVPFFRSLWSRYIDAIRFVPLAAVTGIFIAWFGIYMDMKVQFLAFGIFVFLVPVVVQRIDEVDQIYLQTSYTLGATSWQTIRKVYWPHVTSRIIDDVRVLTAISWTYIIVAELVNTEEGGLGSLIFKAQRTSRLDKVFAILLLIVLIGFVQDLIFGKLDRWIFPHKYQKKTK